MKSLLTITFLFFVSLCFGQPQQNCDVVYDLAIAYRPAFIQLLTGTDSSQASNVTNIQKMTYKIMQPGYYKIQISGPEQKTEIKDSIFIKEGQQLVLNIKIDGPCWYDHAANYIPICPKNHTDNIIPIVYGLIAAKVDTFIKNKKDEKVRYAGCVITGCDPQFYCKQHNIEF